MYGSISKKLGTSKQLLEELEADVRRSLGRPEDFLVGGCGGHPKKNNDQLYSMI